MISRLPRRQFLGQLSGAALAAAAPLKLACAEEPLPAISMEKIRGATLTFIDSMRSSEGPYGRYRYSDDVREPTLYSSAYAAMTRSLYNDLPSLSDEEREEWVAYLQSHQQDDGMFACPVATHGQANEHLSWHVTTALHCLGANAAKPLRWIDPYKDREHMAEWLAERRWGRKVDYASNIVQNLCVALQYARDFHNDSEAASAVTQLLDYLAERADPATGLWGDGELDLDKEQDRSRAVQAAYHFWLCWIYDGKMIPYPERAIDQVLRTQNRNGGYGCGVHNKKHPYLSSACEDIDSIDPLVRLTHATDYRQEDIKRSLQRALPWLLTNQTAYGSWVFKRGLGYQYGHPALSASLGAGGMFPTWFRTLTLAYLGQGLPDSEPGRYDWRFVRSPGSHFWGVPAAE